MKKVFLVIITFSFINSVYSQKPNIIGLKFSYGSILPHHEDIRASIKKHVKEVNLQIGIKTNGQYQWQQLWHYPELGFGLYFADLGNPEVLGYSTAAYFYYNKSLLSKGVWSLNFYTALGCAHLSKFFDPRTNYLNITNGSAFNIFANVNLENGFKIDNIILYADLGLTHFSNGGTQMPNLGLNILASSLGIKYKFRENKIVSKPKVFKSNLYDFYFLQSFTMHDDDFSLTDKKNITVSSSWDFGYFVSKKIRLSAGLDIFYDEAGIKYLEQQGISQYKQSDLISYGLHTGFSTVFGRMQFSIQPVFFFYKKYKESNLFERLGFRYYAGKHYVVGLDLIVDFFNAKFIEPSVGFRF